MINGQDGLEEGQEKIIHFEVILSSAGQFLEKVDKIIAKIAQPPSKERGQLLGSGYMKPCNQF